MRHKKSDCTSIASEQPSSDHKTCVRDSSDATTRPESSLSDAHMISESATQISSRSLRTHVEI